MYEPRSPAPIVYGPGAPPIAGLRLACLDMAGTTVRDQGIVLRAFAGALEALGLEGEAFARAMQYAHDTMGLPKTVVFTDILGQGALVEKAMAIFDGAVVDAIRQGGVTEIEGARATLEDLRESGLKIALTTGFSAGVQQAIIEHLGWGALTDLAIAPGPQLRGRPYPDMVLYAALQTRVDDVRQVLVAGDTANDLWSGHRAGASLVAGVLTGSHDRTELEQAPHTHILASIADLVPLLKFLGSART